jgi:anti-sigma factor RsiW
MKTMECNELVERVTDYLEGAIDTPDRIRLDDHLQMCIGCEAHLGEVRCTLRLLSNMPAEPMSDELESSLLATFRTWAASVSPAPCLPGAPPRPGTA